MHLTAFSIGIVVEASLSSSFHAFCPTFDFEHDVSGDQRATWTGKYISPARINEDLSNLSLYRIELRGFGSCLVNHHGIETPPALKPGHCRPPVSSLVAVSRMTLRKLSKPVRRVDLPRLAYRQVKIASCDCIGSLSCV